MRSQDDLRDEKDRLVDLGMIKSLPMSKHYRPWTPTQTYLLPPSPLEWLPEGHLAFFLLDVVASLDLSGIEQRIQQKDARGERPYDPRMMTALLLYAYCVGVFSSRRIARETYEDVAFRVLCGEEHPHFTTVNQFRLDNRSALSGLFMQVLKLCRRAGLVTLGHVSIDGTKVQANASKHKAMSYDRMREEEKKLAEEIQELLHRADRKDEEEDARYGKGVVPEDLPEELRRREGRLARIREAREALEREAAEARALELRDQARAQRAKAQDESVDPVERKAAQTRSERREEKARELDGRGPDDEPPPPQSSDEALPTHQVPTTTDGEPKPKAQRNFTDPESRIMVRDGAYLQGFNAQIAVDEGSQVIVAEALTNQAPDQEHLVPMVERVIANCGEAPDVLTGDAGYFSQANVEHCEQRGILPVISVGRERPGEQLDAAAAKNTAAQRMRARLRDPEGNRLYRRRKAITEPVFGQIKEARGFRRFLLRGLEKVRKEWSLLCLTHNLLKLYRATA